MTKKKYMTDTDFEALLGAVGEAGAIMRGAAKPSRRFALEAPDVVAIRNEFKLSRNKFAQMIGVSARTLEGWEQGRRQPTGAARIFLVIAAKHPEIVAEVVTEMTGAAPRPEVVAQKNAEHRATKKALRV
jgi:putative transcriptional regulator